MRLCVEELTQPGDSASIQAALDLRSTTSVRSQRNWKGECVFHPLHFLSRNSILIAKDPGGPRGRILE